MHVRGVTALLLASVLAFAACGGDDDDDAGGSAPAPETSATTKAAEPELSGELVVFAAASLTDVFEDLGNVFESEHPGVTTTFNFAASSELATQIEQGAPADVFASADQNNMKKAVEVGAVIGEPVVFAKNRLVIVVAEGNPKGITGLTDLVGGGLTLALCAPEVPCGNYAKQAFDKAGLPLPAASQEQNVRAVVEKVALGEADAGIAYTTDVVARDGDVEGVEIPDDQNVIAEYPIAALSLGSNADAAAAWLEFLRTDEAQQILVQVGFLAP